MGIQLNDDGTETDATQSTKQASSNPRPSGAPQNAPGIRDVLSLFSTPSTLSEPASKYIETIQAELDRLGIAIKHKFLTDPQLDVVSFHNADESLHVFLTFQETYTNSNPTVPPVEGVLQLVQQLQANNGKLIDNLVITPNDYGFASKMAAHIARVFQGQVNKTVQQMNVSSFGGVQFSISTNIQQVRDYLTKLNPQASLPRTDIGFVLFMQAPRQVVQGVPQSKEREYIPILAVGGYTKFVNIAGSQYGMYNKANHVPIVTITSISSSVMSDSMITLALPLAADAFIKREGWIMPYTKFGKEDPNLGSLALDENDEPIFIETRGQLEEFRHTHLQPPFLAIDVTDGRARIPGIERFVYTPEVAKERVSSFLNLPPIPTNHPEIVHNHTKEYIGIVNQDIDSRTVDYPTLVSKGVKDFSKIAHFLHLPNDPTVRPSQVLEMYNDYIPAYSNVSVVLDANFITTIASAVSQVLNVTWDAAGAFVDNNVAGLIGNQGNNFQGFSPIGGFGYQAWAPGSFNPFGG